MQDALWSFGSHFLPTKTLADIFLNNLNPTLLTYMLHTCSQLLLFLSC